MNLAKRTVRRAWCTIQNNFLLFIAGIDISLAPCNINLQHQQHWQGQQWRYIEQTVLHLRETSATWATLALALHRTNLIKSNCYVSNIHPGMDQNDKLQVIVEKWHELCDILHATCILLSSRISSCQLSWRRTWALQHAACSIASSQPRWGMTQGLQHSPWNITSGQQKRGMTQTLKWRPCNITSGQPGGEWYEPCNINLAAGLVVSIVGNDKTPLSSTWNGPCIINLQYH